MSCDIFVTGKDNHFLNKFQIIPFASLMYVLRSDTPLIYKAVPSWFVRVEHMAEKLLDNNNKCYW